eukprot:10504758-Ditylum_brightwellii.AAC.1
MEEFFEQFDVAQDLCTAGHNPYSDVQLINIGFDLIFRTAVHNDACKEWLRRPPADKHGQIFAHTSLRHTVTSMKSKPMPQIQGTPLTMLAVTCINKLRKPLHNWQQQQRRT